MLPRGRAPLPIPRAHTSASRPRTMAPSSRTHRDGRGARRAPPPLSTNVLRKTATGYTVINLPTHAGLVATNGTGRPEDAVTKGPPIRDRQSRRYQANPSGSRKTATGHAVTNARIYTGVVARPGASVAGRSHDAAGSSAPREKKGAWDKIKAALRSQGADTR
jgi:hypothetical protein